MSRIEYHGTGVEVDEEGYLLDSTKWDETVARVLAANEGVGELSPERMAIIQFLRDYYFQYNFFPILHSVCMHLHQPGKCVQEQFMHPLKAWKIAGLPKPDEMVLAYLNYGQTPT